MKAAVGRVIARFRSAKKAQLSPIIRICRRGPIRRLASCVLVALIPITAIPVFAQNVEPLRSDISALQQAYVALSHDLEQLKDCKRDRSSRPSEVIKELQGVFTILGIIAAGFWAYYHYFRGRTYVVRLILSAKGTWVENKVSRFLTTSISAKNVGLGRVSLEHDGSLLEIFSCDESEYSSESYGFEVEWNSIAAYPVLMTHQWIEPGETVEETLMFAIPMGDLAAARISFRLVARTQYLVFSSAPTASNAVAIVRKPKAP